MDPSHEKKSASTTGGSVVRKKNCTDSIDFHMCDPRWSVYPLPEIDGMATHTYTFLCSGDRRVGTLMCAGSVEISEVEIIVRAVQRSSASEPDPKILLSLVTGILIVMGPLSFELRVYSRIPAAAEDYSMFRAKMRRVSKLCVSHIFDHRHLGPSQRSRSERGTAACALFESGISYMVQQSRRTAVYTAAGIVRPVFRQKLVRSPSLSLVRAVLSWIRVDFEVESNAVNNLCETPVAVNQRLFSEQAHAAEWTRLLSSVITPEPPLLLSAVGHCHPKTDSAENAL